MDKKVSRLRRARRARAKIRELEAVRLSVHRTSQHIYAQIIAADGGKELKGTGNVDAAKAVGQAIAERAKEAGIKQVAFDRSGFRYHGRVKALADAARENGLEF